MTEDKASRPGLIVYSTFVRFYPDRGDRGNQDVPTVLGAGVGRRCGATARGDGAGRPLPYAAGST